MRKMLLLLLCGLCLCSCTTKDNDDDNNPPNTPTEKEFYIWDLSVMPPVIKTITATLRAEGDSSYIYVDNEEWNVSVTQDQADALVTWFESKTPAGSINPEKGIYHNDVDFFGEPPDKFDHDPKIYLLLTELAAYGGTQFDGYFNIYDQMSDADAQQYGQRSNEKEILYINSEIRPVTDAGTLSVIAHEFVHMIQSNYDSDDMWVEETLAELGMMINGYYTDSAWVNNFLAHPNYSLTGESDNSVNYGACLLWGTYLYEQVNNPAFFRALISEPLDGIAGLESVLGSFGQESFQQHFLNWLMANYLDNPGYDAGQYGYEMIDLNNIAATTYDGYPATHSVTIHRLGANYVVLENVPQSSLSIKVEAESYEDIFIGTLEMMDTGWYSFTWHRIMNNPEIIVMDNPGYLTLPIIITSVSEQSKIDVQLTFSE
jgi:hypothetical protein